MNHVNKAVLLRSLLAAVALFCVVNSKASATLYDLQTLDTFSGRGASLVLDSLGHPYISYSSYNNDLRYQYWDGTAWHKTIIANSGVDHWDTSITLDSMGVPHISYVSTAPYKVQHAWLSQSGWSTDTIASLAAFDDVTNRTDIVSSNSGKVDVIYNDGGTALKEALGSAGNWTIRTIVNTSNGEFASATRKSGAVQVAFGNNFDLWTAAAPLGGAWSYQTVATQQLPWDMDIETDKLGRPAISFSDISTGNNAIWLARFNGASWDLEKVAAFSTSFGTSLAFTADNRPVISFYRDDPGFEGLYLAYGSSPGHWNLDLVDAGQYVGWNSDLAITADNNLNLVYYGGSGLRYAHALVPEPSTVTLAVSGLVMVAALLASAPVRGLRQRRSRERKTRKRKTGQNDLSGL